MLEASFKHLNIPLRLHMEQEEEIFDSRRHLSSSTFLKFRAFEKLGPGTIWLDSDILLLSDWLSLENWLDPNTPLQAISNDSAECDKFNAGVMVLNKPIREGWKQVIESAPSTRFSSDQVIFNAMYVEAYGKLPQRYNMLWGKLASGDLNIRPSIVHYVGPNKPWHLNPRLTYLCCTDDCVWKPYLMMQSGMLGSLPTSIAKRLEALSGKTRRKPLRYYKKEAIGRHFSFLLNGLGLLSLPVAKLLRRAAGNFPQQALHPVHSKANIWRWTSRVDSNEVH